MWFMLVDWIGKCVCKATAIIVNLTPGGKPNVGICND